MKRVLTSLCGILLIASLVYSTNNIAASGDSESGTFIKSVSGIDTFFEGTIITLNILFLFIFLVSILAIIKEEDKNEKKDNALL